MKPNDGNPVTGDDFYNRVDEIRRLTELLLDGQHINLVAPRRCGKTSLMREIMLRLHPQGWATLEADFSSCATTQQFFECLKGKIEDQLAQSQDWSGKWMEKMTTFGKNIKEVKVMNIGLAMQSSGDSSFAELDRNLRDLLKGLAASATNGRLLLGTDEIPIFLARIQLSAGDDVTKQNAIRQEISALLYWLRDLRQDTTLPVTWFHCGSIGLETLVASMGLTHALSGLSHQPIFAFSEEHARGLLQALAKSRNLPLPAASEDRMLERLTWYLPYFVQLHLIKLNEPKDFTRRKHPDYPTVGDVDAAYEQMIEEGKIHFNHWHSRLDEQLTKLRANQARDILCWVAKKGTGMKRDTIVAKLASAQVTGGDARDLERAAKDLLSLLQNDGYLMRDERDFYQFRSPLLRDFWKREFC
jgi:hypothetical protein